MGKKYLKKNVYDAFQERLKYIFKEFDHIYVSFSGGKDSGLLLNMTLDFVKKNYPGRKIGLFHQDFEAQYSYTTQYVTKMFEENLDVIEPFWVCLPMASKTPLSNYELYWYPWDDEKKEIWVRDMPTMPYVIHLRKNPLTFYKYKMPQEDLFKQFGRWYRSYKEKPSVCSGSGQTSLFSAIPPSLIKRIAIKINPGSHRHLKMYILLLLSMIGQPKTCGSPMQNSAIHIMNYTIYSIKRDLQSIKCALPRLSTNGLCRL